MNERKNPVQTGIDVSYAQGKINWEEAKNHIDFAIIRCGYGDNLTSQDDARWKYNADACTQLGFPLASISIPMHPMMHKAEVKPPMYFG